MKYDYLKFIRDNVPKLRKNPLFSKALDEFLSNDIYEDIEGLDIQKKQIILHDDEEEVKTYIALKDNSIEIYHYTGMLKGSITDLTAIESLYTKKDGLYYSYTERFSGEKGIFFSTTTATLEEINKDNRITFDNIKTGIWLYDNKTFCNLISKAQIGYLVGICKENDDDYDYFETFMAIQNTLGENYILPDEFINVLFSINGKNDCMKKAANIEKNVNGNCSNYDYKGIITDKLNDFRSTIGEYISYEISPSTIRKRISEITGIDERLLEFNFFDVLAFKEEKERTRSNLERVKDSPKQMLKQQYHNCMTAEA